MCDGKKFVIWDNSHEFIEFQFSLHNNKHRYWLWGLPNSDAKKHKRKTAHCIQVQVSVFNGIGNYNVVVLTYITKFLRI